MESFATPYPVIFADADGVESQRGFLGIHSVLTYKRFQQLISEKAAGVPASQLSAVFVCRKTGDGDKKQKLPINENTNFNIILNQHNPSRERDAHFLLSVKKSKKDRKAGRKKVEGDEEDVAPDSPPDKGAATPAATPAPLPTTVVNPQAAAREAAQRERERINAALGRAPPAPAPAPAQAPPGPQGPKVDMTKTPVAAALAAANRATGPGGAMPGRAGPGGAPQPQPPNGLQQPPRASGVLPNGALPGGALQQQQQQPPLLQPQGLQPGGWVGQGGQTGEGLQLGPEPSKTCKFCAFCRKRGHEPPFHCCADDRVVTGFRGLSPHGPVCRQVTVQ